MFLSAGAGNLKGVESVCIWKMQARDTEKWLKTAFSFWTSQYQGIFLMYVYVTTLKIKFQNMYLYMRLWKVYLNPSPLQNLGDSSPFFFPELSNSNEHVTKSTFILVQKKNSNLPWLLDGRFYFFPISVYKKLNFKLSSPHSALWKQIVALWRKSSLLWTPNKIVYGNFLGIYQKAHLSINILTGQIKTLL